MISRAAKRPGRHRSRPKPIAWLAAVAALAWAAGVAYGAGADTSGPATRLERLAGDVARRLSLRPLDEPESAASPGPTGMVAATHAVVDSDRVLRAEALDRLRSIEPHAASLAPGRRADLAVLRSRLERWSVERDEMDRFARDPAWQWARVDGSIRRLLLGRPGILCRRLKLTTRRLKAIPEMLRASSLGLDHPSRLAAEAALDACERTLALYRRVIPAAVRDCREPSDVANLAEADTLAARALGEYMNWIRSDLMPLADGTWAMGGERYARWLRAATGDSTPVDTWRERARRELDAMPPPVPGPGVERADSVRAAHADSLLAARAAREWHGSSSGLRTVLGDRAFALPWADLTARIPADRRESARGAPAAEPLRFAPTRLDLVAMLAELDLHGGAVSIDEARHRLETDAGLDSAAALAEARRAALSPSRAITVVTSWRLENVRQLAQDRLGRRYSPRAFLEATLDEGAVPIAAVREPILLRLGVRVTDATERDTER